MKILTPFGTLALNHWTKLLPNMTLELERNGRLHEMLHEAEQRAVSELDDSIRHFRNQGLTPQQANSRAWKILQERYVFLKAK